MKSLQELAAIRDKMKQTVNTREAAHDTTRVVVGMATCGIAAGARPVLNEFATQVAEKDLHGVLVTQTGCIGICQFEPVVEVYLAGQEKVTYVHMTPEKADRVIQEHLIGGKPVEEYTIGASAQAK
ncbi:MAG: (2Fe-2S) ferredoxin domain-containing protein [Oscillospiraceae bacterium]